MELQPYRVERACASLEEAKGDEALLRDVLNVGPGRRHRCPFHDGSTKGRTLDIRPLGGVWLFRCWSPSCNVGGTVVDALSHRNGIQPSQACALLLGGASGPVRRSRYRKTRASPATVSSEEPDPPKPRAARIDAALKVIRESIGEFPEMLARRGIPEWVAREHSVGYVEDVSFVSRRNGKKCHQVTNAWLMPITDVLGNVVAIKIHREQPADGQSKSGWLPVGRWRERSPHGFHTLWPAPEAYDRDGLDGFLEDWPDDVRRIYRAEREFLEGILPDDEVEERAVAAARRYARLNHPEIPDRWLYLCPGELKALAMVGAQLDATAITGGESRVKGG